MKVLFVCRANIGRSQAACELYKRHKNGTSASAGTLVETPGRTLAAECVAHNILQVMQEHGINMSDNERTCVEDYELNQFDKIVVMAEPDTTPAWLESHPKIVRWKIDDPLNKNIDQTRLIVRQIQAKVSSLVR